MTAKRSASEWTAHDHKELARFMRKYGRASLLTEAKNVLPPRSRGRPRVGPQDNRELKEDIAWAVVTWAQEYRETGSRKPVEEALLDLHAVLGGGDDYGRWRKTALRKRSDVGRQVEARLKFARDTAPIISGLKKRARSNRAINSRA